MKLCYGPTKHVKDCRPGRPLCRWMRVVRANRRPCRCDAYHFVHRTGSGACRVGIPAAILKSPSWRRLAAAAAQ